MYVALTKVHARKDSGKGKHLILIIFILNGYLFEFQLNKTNFSITAACFLDSHLSISYGKISCCTYTAFMIR